MPERWWCVEEGCLSHGTAGVDNIRLVVRGVCQTNSHHGRVCCGNIYVCVWIRKALRTVDCDRGIETD